MKYFAAAIIALAVSPVAAQDRAEFKGVPLGTSMKEFHEKNPLFWCEYGINCTLPFLGDSMSHCRQLKRTEGRNSPTLECIREVIKTATYANAPARLRAIFREGIMTEANASISPENFSSIVEALSTRYGPPLTKRAEVVQNRMGATFQNETYEWNVGGDQILAMKYGTDLTRGLISIMDQQAVQRLLEGVDKRRKSAPSDL